MYRALIFVAVVAFATATPTLRSEDNEELRFDDNFLFGVASAAYQIEGAWNEDGKGESIWDHMLHEHPEYTEDRQNGDVAADSYHRYRDDVKIVKEMNMDFYRFSISWPRILPNGDLSLINAKGVEYYNNLIDELLANGIEPMVTMFHWDLPYALQELGGWANRHIATYFRDYADLLFKTYGNKVKWWITLNEPQSFCRGYSGDHFLAPGVEHPGVGEYLCGHTALLAHAHAYHLYEETYRAKQKGEVGITLNSFWYTPKTENDKNAAERAIQFWLGWFANPVFSKEGNYPQVMRERVAANSAKEKLRRSRLPVFTQEEINYIKGTADFFGLNHYTTNYAEEGEEGKTPSADRDAGAIITQNASWPSSGSDWLKVTPTGFRDLLNWIRNAYGDVRIIITENGFSDRNTTVDGILLDDGRVTYFEEYLREMHKAIYTDGVKVFGYTAWTLIDNFEWLHSYQERFGLYYVNFSDPSLTRSAKKSSIYLGEIALTHVVPSQGVQLIASSILLAAILLRMCIFP
ncbi:hypothetical protein R5R35_014769 [Gryllus longicercus]|uniref:beta-glucosidase n=1 Tax=Gryllus longicercus TaxID=2509291 RepID=A0AAN9Z9L4_9ORTH